MGFDPGVGGGVSVLGPSGQLLYTRGFNKTMSEDDVLKLVQEAATVLLRAGGWECYTEKVGFIKGDGGKGAFTFGGVYKFVRGVLRAWGIHLYNVPPVLWQTKLECLTGGDKNVSKRRAVELFPGVKVTHANADSLLIALYGRLMTGSTPVQKPPCVLPPLP